RSLHPSALDRSRPPSLRARSPSRPEAQPPLRAPAPRRALPARSRFGRAAGGRRPGRAVAGDAANQPDALVGRHALPVRLQVSVPSLTSIRSIPDVRARGDSRCHRTSPPVTLTASFGSGARGASLPVHTAHEETRASIAAPPWTFGHG